MIREPPKAPPTKGEYADIDDAVWQAKHELRISAEDTKKYGGPTSKRMKLRRDVERAWDGKYFVRTPKRDRSLKYQRPRANRVAVVTLTRPTSDRPCIRVQQEEWMPGNKRVDSSEGCRRPRKHNKRRR